MYKEIHTGNDPRNYLEFSEIRNEINKINHPAAAEVDFKNIESLALELFSKNGVDLQTAAYFTYANTKLYGIDGFNEGCELIATLISNSWQQLWPTSETARIDVLDWLNVRVGQDIRGFPFKTKDIPRLIQIEQPLRIIVDKIKEQKLKKTPKIVELYGYIKNTRTTLEKRLIEEHAARKNIPIRKHESILIYRPEPLTPEKPAVHNAEPEHSPQVINKETVIIREQAKFRGWHGFILGAMLTGGALFSFDQYRSDAPKPEKINLDFFVPLALSDVTQLTSQKKAAIIKYDVPQFSDYKNQLQQIVSLSPLAIRYYGDNLINVSAALWPEDREQRQMADEWNKWLETQRQDRFMRNGYYEAQNQLQTLSDELKRAEEQRRSVTISQLKSAVFNIQTSLNQEPPLEELLRQLSAEESPSPVLAKNIDERFNNLLSYYYYLSTSHS